MNADKATQPLSIPTEEELAWAALARQRAMTRDIRPPKKETK